MTKVLNHFSYTHGSGPAAETKVVTGQKIIDDVEQNSSEHCEMSWDFFLMCDILPPKQWDMSSLFPIRGLPLLINRGFGNKMKEKTLLIEYENSNSYILLQADTFPGVVREL